MYTVWEFRSVDGTEVKRVLRTSQPGETAYEHYYQRILYRGTDFTAALAATL